jgi:hypothetical protein
MTTGTDMAEMTDLHHRFEGPRIMSDFDPSIDYAARAVKGLDIERLPQGVRMPAYQLTLDKARRMLAEREELLGRALPILVTLDPAAPLVAQIREVLGGGHEAGPFDDHQD